MQLGAFSVSLAVKDIEGSRTFYKKLGFEEFGGDVSQNWLILKNGDHVIGLFQGMFDKNILTFNPGWDQNASQLDRMNNTISVAPRSGGTRTWSTYRRSDCLTRSVAGRRGRRSRD